MTTSLLFIHLNKDSCFLFFITLEFYCRDSLPNIGWSRMLELLGKSAKFKMPCNIEIKRYENAVIQVLQSGPTGSFNTSISILPGQGQIGNYKRDERRCCTLLCQALSQGIKRTKNKESISWSEINFLSITKLNIFKQVSVFIISDHLMGQTTPLPTTKPHCASVLGDSDKVARPYALLPEYEKR